MGFSFDPTMLKKFGGGQPPAGMAPPQGMVSALGGGGLGAQAPGMLSPADYQKKGDALGGQLGKIAGQFGGAAPAGPAGGAGLAAGPAGAGGVAGAGAGAGGGAKKKAAAAKAAGPAKPLTGDKLIANLLEGTLRGENTTFGPNVINNMVSGALGDRAAAQRTGLDDVNRQIASRGLGRSPLGASMAGDVIRGSQQDYSKRIGDLYQEKAKSDFADKMGAIPGYQSHLNAVQARKNAARSASLAEQRFAWEKEQAANRPKGGGGGGGGDEDMLFKLLMGME